MVHDDAEFVEGAAAALRLAGHKVDMFREPMEALIALETAQFEILITRARFPVGQPNGVALAQMARMIFEGYFDGTLLVTLAEKTRLYLTGYIEGMTAEEAAVVAFLRLRLGELAASDCGAPSQTP